MLVLVLVLVLAAVEVGAEAEGAGEEVKDQAIVEAVEQVEAVMWAGQQQTPPSWRGHALPSSVH